MWRYIKLVFGRPLLASGIVGFSIHTLLEVNEHIYRETSYILRLLAEINQEPVYGILKLLIPFFIPFMVTYIGRKILIQTETSSLLKFPQANPDIVMQLGPNAEVLYFNHTAELLLKQLDSAGQSLTVLLPDDAARIVAEIIGTDRTEIREMRIGDKMYEYCFRAFHDERAVFLSGRDITKRWRLEQELRSSHRRLVEINNFADHTFNRFDPFKFDVLRHYRAIMSRLLKDEHEIGAEKPSHIFSAFQRPDGLLVGHVYSKLDGQVIRDSEEITIDPFRQKVAIMRGRYEVTWSNWEDENQSLAEFQNNFDDRVQAKVGTIERYITYQSQDIALIAFFQGRKLSELDAQVLKSLTVYAQSLKIISDQVKNTEDAFIYTIEALARAAEANDVDTGNHILRINNYARHLAEKLGLDAEFVKSIHYSAQMHDVGKIHIHPDILKKPGSLSKEEFARMTHHTEKGARILGDASRLKMAREIALAHHEKYDGSGYPYGLKGDQIPMAARIVCIVDVYDALRQKRSYKPSFSHAKAFRIITEGDGRIIPEHFDPQILEAFKQTEDQIQKIFESTPEFGF